MPSEKDYSNRAAVRQYLPYWTRFLAEKGREETLRFLSKGWTNRLTSKDRKGLIQALKLRGDNATNQPDSKGT